MITREQIRTNLKDIRYYYSHREFFDMAKAEIGRHCIVDMAEEYNRTMCMGDPKLYELYYYLYVKCNTQETTAMEMNCCFDYINKNTTKIIDYLFSELNKKVKS